MKGIADYAVVYDITSDAERARVDRVLKGFGFRVQKSVFECRLNKRSRDKLIEKLSDLHLTTGFIKVYRLEYSSKQVVIGKPKKKSIDNGYAFII
ncbi:MAG: CRISPR-associated endonuclease Cas2 [candidate division WOR-3 bacterium]